ncbi:hypothetical protein T310_6271, partial [Rasamsonia emersonii CBS 393.64]
AIYYLTAGRPVIEDWSVLAYPLALGGRVQLEDALDFYSGPSIPEIAYGRRDSDLRMRHYAWAAMEGRKLCAQLDPARLPDGYVGNGGWFSSCVEDI